MSTRSSLITVNIDEDEEEQQQIIICLSHSVCVCVCAAFHEVSVYPKKELPFFILFTAGLCSFTALLALLTHQYPEPMGVVVRTVCGWSLRVSGFSFKGTPSKEALQGPIEKSGDQL